MKQTTSPDKRKNESNAEYKSRCYRWNRWLQNEPLVDLYLVSDTEVAEYRKWARTTKRHEDTVNELMAIADNIA